MEQICSDGVKKWNKTYSFEVSMGLVHLFLIVTKNEPYSESLEQIGLDGSQEIEQNIQILKLV